MKPVDKLIQQANDILDGEGGPTEDWRDALDLFQAAGSMGSAKAYERIGFMYSSGRFMKKNDEKALFNYKKSAKLGYINAFTGMAITYNRLDDVENCWKAWHSYLSNFNDDCREDASSNFYICIFFHYYNKISLDNYLIFLEFEKEIVKTFKSIYSHNLTLKDRQSKLIVEYVNANLHRKTEIEKIIQSDPIDLINHQIDSLPTILSFFMEYCRKLREYKDVIDNIAKVQKNIKETEELLFSMDTLDYTAELLQPRKDKLKRMIEDMQKIVIKYHKLLEVYQ